MFDFHLFADDSILFLTDLSLDTLETRVNQELKHVHDWLCANKLSLNIDKTNFVIFHPFQKKETAKTILFKVNQTPIKQKDHIKYLGVVIDAHLNFTFIS